MIKVIILNILSQIVVVLSVIMQNVIIMLCALLSVTMLNVIIYNGTLDNKYSRVPVC